MDLDSVILNRQGGSCLVVETAGEGRFEAEVLESSGWQVIGISESEPSLPPTTAGIQFILLPDRLRPSVRLAFEKAAAVAGIPVVSSLELAFQHCLCLVIAVAGAVGKSSALRILQGLLLGSQKRTAWLGEGGRSNFETLAGSKELDYLVFEAGEGGLAGVHYFRPAIAVVTSLAEDLDAAGVANVARLFARQQPFDWLVIQSEALARLRMLGVEPPSKVVTFSATSRRADIYLERGMLLSQWPGWSGPLMDTRRGLSYGGEAPENLMAALAVGRILRIPLETMAQVLSGLPPAVDCCERLGEVGGVGYVNDAASKTTASLRLALSLLPEGAGGVPNVFLIAGGESAPVGSYEVGPILSKRVRRCLVRGKAANSLRAAWGLFTPCTVVSSLLEAVSLAADEALPGDIVLFSPACTGPDKSLDHQDLGDMFREAVRQLTHRNARAGSTSENPASRSTGGADAIGRLDANPEPGGGAHFARGNFLREKPQATTSYPTISPQALTPYAHFVA